MLYPIVPNHIKYHGDKKIQMPKFQTYALIGGKWHPIALDAFNPLKTKTGGTTQDKICSGWSAYQQRYPDRAAWLLTTLAKIKQHPTCHQFPDALCDYVTTGILHEDKKQWYEAFAGKLEGKNHVWLYDRDAQLHIDFTAHQFPVTAKRLQTCEIKVIVLSTPALASYGYQFASQPKEYGKFIASQAKPLYLQNLQLQHF
jgi:hypothetical protein